jgi:hypothetical protein
MAWRLEGTYVESCSCDPICPGTWSVLRAKATHDRCRMLLVCHIDSGTVEGVDVSGLTVALFADAPQVVSEGHWRVGIFIDLRASEAQAEKLRALASGQLGGPPAMFAAFYGEILGVQRARIEYTADGRSRRVRIGDAVDVAVQDFIASEGSGPVQLTNVVHPANSTLTVAPTTAARLCTFGIHWGRAGQSGFSAPFSWSG